MEKAMGAREPSTNRWNHAVGRRNHVTNARLLGQCGRWSL